MNKHGDTSGSPDERVKFDNEIIQIDNKDNEASNIENKNKNKVDTLEKDTILVFTKEEAVLEATKQIVRAATTRKPQPGDNGLAVNVNVSLLSDDEKRRYDEGFKGNAFNEFASDLVSLHRKIPDSRPQLCKNITYASNLPQTSVIITFYNEAWSTLIRSIHSVLERSPPHLIKEIILVDDGSEKDILGKPLEDYIRNFPKVKLFRNKERVGLVSARLKGCEEATAPILTYLDSHIECNQGWLEPLLDPIAKDETVSTFPTLDVIDDETLKYDPLWESPSYGVFRWRTLLFNWDNMPPVVTKARKTVADNIRSPTMPGGLFSISKAYFQKLGTYDPEMKGWGGENLELSFKIWMCNGTLLMVPCSHVGHIFRHVMPYTIPGENTVWKNSARVAEVWMDEYKQYLYDYYKPDLSQIDVSSRKELRKSLHCKSFDWYYKNLLAPTMWIPNDVISGGHVKSINKPSYCLDSMLGDGVYGLYQCYNNNANQNFYFTKEGLLLTEVSARDFHKCVSFYTKPSTLRKCDVKCRYQIFKYQNSQFFNPATNKCLAIPISRDLKGPEEADCDDKSRTLWEIHPRIKHDDDDNDDDDD
ncbi:hypothetical protein SNE40_010807 [Patella caerulea]|uniref:Polypeptide N-acetylgalactosaminyltransferase n=1 Tax=Patella caerulea TaxID=87958 RepID=A0AAN8JSQ7_PATCE